jgi:hypothetical protein
VVTELSLSAPRGSLRQGAVYQGIPVFWIPDNMAILRPHGETDWLSITGHPWREVHDRFRLGDGVESVVVHAKARPVVVVSSDAELRPSQPVRVVPLYSYRPGTFAERERGTIEAGRMAHLLHVKPRGALREGFLNLREASSVPLAFFEDAEPVADLDQLSVATLLRHFATYIAA